jgi:uncharacterized repeat protein (TIGR03803 family)
MKNSIRIFAVLAALWAASLCQAQSFNIIYTFPSQSVGFAPNGVPYIGDGGVLFGTTQLGGTFGTVFSLTPPAQAGGLWTENLLYSFQGAPDGSEPRSGVVAGSNGSLLGTTRVGGPRSPRCPGGGCGTMFQLTPPSTGGEWTEQILYDFGTGDLYPEELIAGSGGVLFGAGGIPNEGARGSVYEFLPPAETGGGWSLAPIHEFPPKTGEVPNSPLALGANGVLYGTTQLGGNKNDNNETCKTFGCGTVFALTPPTPPATAWSFQDIYRFHGGSDGSYPYSGLAVGADGTLYGTTYYGGGSECASGAGCGTVFSLKPPESGSGFWTETILYSFQGGPDGAFPASHAGGLAIGAGGVIYGVTSAGGGLGCSGEGCGILFQLTPPAAGGKWTETILHIFTGGTDGGAPNNGPAIDANGVLYGFAFGGTGTSCDGGGCGVVYQYLP